MAAVRVQSATDLLQREIDVGSFPGASYACGSIDALEGEDALGLAVAVPFRIRATTDTIHDCASLTKVAATTILVLQAVAEQRIALDDEYRGYTFRELLTHSSGLRAWLPLYALSPHPPSAPSPLAEGRRVSSSSSLAPRSGERVAEGRMRGAVPSDYVRAIEERGPEYPRGTRVVYSDLNFVLLWSALNEIFGDYVRAARERIFEPLQLRDAMFNPPPLLKPRIAATEWGQRFESGMASAREIPFHGFRTGLMWGEVNDGNSFYAGGTCGNAGLFATARDVFRIVQAFARGELVPHDLVRESTRVHIGDRGLGWQITKLGYGHNGFTGTSAWVNGDRISVLLTNRIHPCAAPIAMQRIREEFHVLVERRRPGG